MLYVSGTNPGFAEGSGSVLPHHGTGVATLHTRAPGRRGFLFVLWSAALVAAATAAVLVFVRRTETGQEPIAPNAAAAPESPVEPPPSPEAIDAPKPAAATGEEQAREVRLQIDSSPQGATVTLAGERLGRTPLDTLIASSDEDAELEIDLRGYKSAVRSLKLDKDATVEVSLQRESRDSRDSRDRRSSSSSRKGNGSKGNGKSSGKSSDSDDRDRPPAADLDIKEGR